jgi:hypothetical protein
MKIVRLLDVLSDEVRRLRQLAGEDLRAPVPTCPGWVLDDLIRHVARGYRIVLGQGSAPVGRTALAELDESYVPLVKAFAVRPDRFWIRRMAQESALHRFDAELALGLPITPFPEDFALDGIGEMLDVFLHRETHNWTADYAAYLSEWGERWVRIGDWRVEVHPSGVDVTPTVSVDADARVRGEPGPLLLWLYNRDDDVFVEGDPALVAQLKLLLGTAMNA